MIDKKELLQKIDTLQLDPDVKNKITAFVKVAGLNMLEFIYSEVQKRKFEFFAETLSEMLFSILQADNKIKQGDWSLVELILNNSEDDPKLENGLYLLPWVFDLEREVEVDKLSISEETAEALVIFKIRLFEYLPISQLDFLLQNFAVSILKSNYDLLFLFKRYLYKKHFEGDKNYTKSFLFSLSRNRELLSEEPLLRAANKTINANFETILKDFLLEVPNKNLLNNLQISKYLISFKNITEDVRNILFSLFDLYLWFLNPVVSREDAYPEIYKDVNLVINPNLYEEDDDNPDRSETKPPFNLEKKLDQQNDLLPKKGAFTKNPIISGLKPPLVLPKNIQAGMAAKPLGKDLDVAIKPNAAPVKPVTAGLEDIRKEIEHKKALAQAEIEKKLEGLKKRGSK